MVYIVKCLRISQFAQEVTPMNLNLATKASLVAVFMLSGVLVSVAQSERPPQPTPTPYLGRAETGLEKTRRLDREHTRIEQQTFKNLYGQGSFKSSNRAWRNAMLTMYRKPKKSEMQAVSADEELRRKYGSLLSDKSAGIIRLLPTSACSKDGKVVSTSDKCLKYPFPGAGASYSFRFRNYRIRRLADLTLVGNALIARGVLTGAIFVELGHIPLEQLTLDSPGVGYLVDYKPVSTATEALDSARMYAKGVENGGFLYGRGVYFSEGTTVVLRSIAYRGQYLRSVAGIVYNELDFDKRRDVIVAFKVVRVAGDGSVTLLYKILSDRKAQKLKDVQRK